jgi:hypothetical protein
MAQQSPRWIVSYVRWLAQHPLAWTLFYTPVIAILFYLLLGDRWLLVVLGTIAGAVAFHLCFVRRLSPRILGHD